MDIQLPYEVEIRFHFASYGEACERIPFLEPCLITRKTWDSRIYGLNIFKSGKLLRIGVLSPEIDPRFFLCMKGPDIGSFANIRHEIEEEITHGIKNSDILEQLGGEVNAESPDEVVNELERLGHSAFMSFGGEDSYGNYEPFGIEIKLMSCSSLKYPLMVEFEKIASTEAEAVDFENDLLQITEKLNLIDILVKDEPPILMYKNLFG